MKRPRFSVTLRSNGAVFARIAYGRLSYLLPLIGRKR